MINLLLSWVQPLAVIIFVIAGILCLIQRDWLKGIINLSIAQANFFIFFGDKLIK